MYAWVDGRVKFAKYRVNNRLCFSETDRDRYMSRLTNPAMEELESPAAELLEKCEGKTFKNYTEIKAFIESMEQVII
jgi:hypothetical protein